MWTFRLVDCVVSLRIPMQDHLNVSKSNQIIWLEWLESGTTDLIVGDAQCTPTEIYNVIHTTCSCYVQSVEHWDQQNRDLIYQVWRYRGLGGEISSLAVDKSDENRPIAFLSQKRDGNKPIKIALYTYRLQEVMTCMKYLHLLMAMDYGILANTPSHSRITIHFLSR